MSPAYTNLNITKRDGKNQNLTWTLHVRSMSPFCLSSLSPPHICTAALLRHGTMIAVNVVQSFPKQLGKLGWAVPFGEGHWGFRLRDSSRLEVMWRGCFTAWLFHIFRKSELCMRRAGQQFCTVSFLVYPERSYIRDSRTLGGFPIVPKCEFGKMISLLRCVWYWVGFFIHYIVALPM